MVVSGLVEPLTTGAFSRAHSDIDIAVPEDRLDAMVEAASRRGYVVTTRVLRTHASRRFDAELHWRVKPHESTRRWRHLRLWRPTQGGELDESVVPSYIDVFPYRLSDGEIWILDTGEHLAIRHPLAFPVDIPGGATVPVEDPYLLEALRNSRRSSETRDRRFVEFETPARGDARARR